MKKIMFNDKYGLTQAVLEGRKTMTRRIVNFDRVHTLIPGRIAKCCLKYAPYKVGEVVAVAQSYDSIIETLFANDEQWRLGYIKDVEDAHERLWRDILGRKNKMFVRADLMPHQIRITNIRVERLQDISDEDCIREGIERIYYGDEEWFKAYDTKDGCKCAPTPKEAFAALIDKVSGKGTWKSNPWVFVYEFELI